MLEVVTTTNAQEVKNTLSRLGISSMAKHFYTHGRAISNLIGGKYVPLLIFLDKDGNITNVSYYDSNSDVIRIIKTIEGTTSK
ncbi:MAG: hypothetical protein Q4Q17_00135 [Tissierellia bacterium]|nr:hypothetical protein [Tissierellia bacterium]